MAEVVMFCVACTRGVRKNELKYADGRVFHAECYAKLGGSFVAPDASVAEQSAKLKMDLIELKNQLTILKRKSGSRPKARKKAAAKKAGRKRPKGKAKKSAKKAGRKRPKSAAKKTGRKRPKGKAKKNAAKKPRKAAKAGRKRPKSAAGRTKKSAKKAGRKRR